jgi:hypothetical protein
VAGPRREKGEKDAFPTPEGSAAIRNPFAVLTFRGAARGALPYLAVVALPPICAAATIYAFAGRSPTLAAPTVRFGNEEAPLVHPGIQLVAQ